MMNTTIAGNVGNVERATIGDQSALKFSVAVNKYDKNAPNNQRTVWVNCTWFGTRAEKMAQYITKGGYLTVSGDLDVREYTKDGVKRYSVDLRVNDVTLGPKRESGTTTHTTNTRTTRHDDGDEALPF